MNMTTNTILITPVLAGTEMPTVTVNSVAEAFARFEYFSQKHAVALAKLKENWSTEERAYNVGFSVEFRSAKSGNTIVVHGTNDGGILMCRQDGRLRLTKGSFESDELVAFLHPDWTEFKLSELSSYDFLTQVITRWEEKGSIPEEFLR